MELQANLDVPYPNTHPALDGPDSESLRSVGWKPLWRFELRVGCWDRQNRQGLFRVFTSRNWRGLIATGEQMYGSVCGLCLSFPFFTGPIPFLLETWAVIPTKGKGADSQTQV
jgi:hypothetical protein